MEAYIFDLDGTLLDSMGVWAQIDIDFLAKRSFDVPADYMYAVSSLSFPEAAQYTIERFSLPDSVEDLQREWYQMAEYAYGNIVQLKPYAKEYISKLRQYPVKLGIATSLSETLYVPALEHLGIGKMFDAISSTEKMAFGKTRPDVFLTTAKKLGVLPEDCIVFEDILEAIRSAKQAGMTVYGVYDKTSKDNWTQIENISDGVLFDFKSAPLPEKRR